MLEKDIQRQLDVIRRGTELVIDELELADRIENSIRQNAPLTVKLGVDPTAPELHLGHTVVLRKLRHFQDLGHQAVFLIGDFTGRIGDPTGRDKSRIPLTESEVRRNAETYKRQIAGVVDVTRLKTVRNSSWLKRLTFEDVVRLTSTATVAQLLEHNTFRERFQHAQSIRMNELLYPFMQAYDSVELQADIELGGTDQTFNLTFGRDLQRCMNQKPQVCITLPILPGTDGKLKMSKSLGNSIGVSDSPYVMFEKIMRMVDDNIVPYFLLLTDKPTREIEKLRDKLSGDPPTEYILRQKRELASSIVRTFYGPEAAGLAQSSYGRIEKEVVGVHRVPLVECDSSRSIPILRLLVISGRASSNSEARRLIRQGAVSVNNSRIENADQRINVGQETILRIGKTYLSKLIAS